MCLKYVFPKPENRNLRDLLLHGHGDALLLALVPDHLVHVLLDRADQLVVRVVGAVHNVLEALQVVVTQIILHLQVSNGLDTFENEMKNDF